MDRGTEQTFSKRGNPYGQQAYEKEFNITNHHRNRNQNHEIFSLITDISIPEYAQV